MSKYTWIIDNGHGGMIDGEYTTAPSKMHVFPDGLTIYEGVFNRGVKKHLVKMLHDEGINCVDLVPEDEDISLGERVRRANELHKQHENCVYVSIHGNAGGGTGFEVWTSPGQTKSDPIATKFFEQYEKIFSEEKPRKDTSDGDPDKESRFYVLVKTACPAILTENFFMDQRKDALLMLSMHGQHEIARVHFEAIENIECDDSFQP